MLFRVYIPKKSIRIFNRTTNEENRVVVVLVSDNLKYLTHTGIFYKKQLPQSNYHYNSCVKTAIITEIISMGEVKDVTMQLYDLNLSINYLLSKCGYREVLVPMKYVEVCKLTNLQYDKLVSYIIFSRK